MSATTPAAEPEAAARSRAERLLPLNGFVRRSDRASLVAVLGLIDRHTPVTAWRARRADGVAVGPTFVTTLLLGVEPGLAAGVVFSLGAFVWRSARPHTAELGRVPCSDLYRNVDRYEVRTDPSVLLLRVDGPLYFANAERLEDQVLDTAERRGELRAVVLDAAAISDSNADGAHALGRLRERLADRGVTLHLATVRGPVRDLLERAGVWVPFVASGAVHADTAAAVAALPLGSSSPLLDARPAADRDQVAVF